MKNFILRQTETDGLRVTICMLIRASSEAIFVHAIINEIKAFLMNAICKALISEFYRVGDAFRYVVILSELRRADSLKDA